MKRKTILLITTVMSLMICLFALLVAGDKISAFIFLIISAVGAVLLAFTDFKEDGGVK